MSDKLPLVATTSPSRCNSPAALATTVVLLVAALIGGIWTMRKARRSTFLRHTRQELANDRSLLEDDKP